MNLAERKCVPCEKGGSALGADDIDTLAKEIPKWKVADNRIIREINFEGFREAIDFINDVADLAEDQDHHPDLFISYNKVIITLWTHNVNGLSPNDFIMAAKIGEIIGDEQ